MAIRINITKTETASGFSRMPMKTGQTQSFVNGDDGFWQSGQDIFTLPIVNGVQQLNHFGNKWRFTGIRGGYYDRDTSQYKNADGTVTTREVAYVDNLRADHASKDWFDTVLMWWFDPSVMTINRDWADSMSFCNLLTVGDFAGNWKMPNILEFMTLYNSVDDLPIMNMTELLDNGAPVTFWTSGSLFWFNTYTLMIYNDGNIAGAPKTNSMCTLACRRTSLSEFQ